MATTSTTPSPAEQAKSNLNLLRSRWNGIASRGSLNSMASEIETLGRAISTASATIKDLRQRGYAFGRGWEERSASLTSGWASQRAVAERMIITQANILRSAAQQVDVSMSRATSNPLALLSEAERRVDSYEEEVERSEKMVRGAFSSAKDKESGLSSELEAAKFALEKIDAASFKLEPEENVYIVARGEWLEGPDKPDGFFFLTDRRVIFEQNEEVAAAKVLFITTKKEKVQKMLWAFPVGVLEEIKSEDRGGVFGMGAKELVLLKLADAPHNMPLNNTIHVKDGATNDVWNKAIMFVKSGQIENERFGVKAAPASAPAAAETKQTIQAPTVCPACGGKLPQAFKGMSQLTCEYCGMAVNIG